MNTIRKLIPIILVFLISNLSLAQQIQFKKYNIPNVGYISIPSNMEIQSGKYKNKSESIGKKMVKKYDLEELGIGNSNNLVVFQQKGLNNFKKKGFSTYARVIIETDIGNYGDYKKLTSNYTMTNDQINKLNEFLKRKMLKTCSGTPLKLIDWYRVSTTKINGRPALKMSYLRQTYNNPYVIVKMYLFPNNDRIHRLTLSYRQSDKTIWKPLFSKILKSFTITNVR